MVKLKILLVLILIATIIVGGCTTTRQPEDIKPGEDNILTPLTPEVTVTVGMKQVVSDAGILIGMAKGYYKELGINIQPTQFNSGQEMINSLAAGQLDVGATVTASGLFNAILRGIPIKIVADKGYNVPGMGYYRLVIRKDLVDEIRDYEDLRGRKIAIVATASLDEIALDRVLNQGGMTTEDVDLQIIRSFPDILMALGNQSIDAGMLIEPFVTQGIEKGMIDPWKDPSEYDPDAQTALLVYGKSIIERPEIAKRFMVGYIKSLRDYNDAFFKNINREEIISILAEYSVVKDPEIYEKMYPTGLNPDGYVREKGIALDLEWYEKRGLLIGGTLTVEEVVDNQYVDAAVKALGKYK
ncbi:Putative aliphatic sulfonates-binding protein [Koleobacter methoxysyntrophicus]|jgi:NitT/TauT family transport system substrate-binding protein|uniref:Aliphatic sulfonates-binding protein n=1 Tax=Koleobacter methoxysyntrophicus TaxID=2751313 RepID=A0A8A0RM55_9FIRM|nr:ABC transporter substrate-binding protein [Koleobacter methoxysyntrophicus]QSQ09481.1 Putative aliphatic sulfonates-binding protein [Koleobacter methoxysyntrophicus]